MPFDSGKLSLAFCQLPSKLPDDILEHFIARKAGPLSAVAEEPKVGWVTGRHLLDTDINEQTAIVGGYLHLVMRTAQRKVPPSLLTAECRIEELAYMQANEMQFVPRKEKKRIKQDVSERLIKQMPPNLSGIPCAIDRAHDALFVGSSSLGKLDNFLGYFCQTAPVDPVHLSPEMVAERIFNVNPREIPGLNFSPDRPGEDMNVVIGRDFLTWIWYFQFIEGGLWYDNRKETWGLLLDGPLHFVGDSSNALESVVRKGIPTTSAEAKASLMVGKKLKKGKLTFVRADQKWEFTLDAENFLFSGLGLPAGEELDASSHFQERIIFLHELRDAFFCLFKQYLDDVTDKARFKELQEKILKWVKELQSE